MPPDRSHCEALASPSYTNFTLSILILIGILVSYLPQHHRIIARRSSEGISPYFVLLGTISGTCAFANILVLPTSRADVACCKEINGFECFAGLLGIAQVGVQWSCFTFILFLFLIFFPRATALPPPNSPSMSPSYRTALLVTATCIIHAIATFTTSLILIALHPEHLQPWANTLGILATVLASIQYFPQLYTTFRLKHVGSLSIPMMCIQTPGSFVWAGSLAARLGKEGWSAWGVYVVTGCLQGTLLGMGIYFEVMDRRKKKDQRSNGAVGAESSNLNGHAQGPTTADEGGPEAEGDGAEGDERTPLLRNAAEG